MIISHRRNPPLDMAVPRVSAAPRLSSVDALRGMTVAAMLLVNDAGDWGHVYAPLEHSVWNGCTPTDLVFPFFLFVVGVSIALSLVRNMEAGASRADLQRGILLRASRIVLLGLALHALAYWLMDVRAFRPFGVLQRIGLCFGVAGLFAIHTRARTQWIALAVILLGYWALLEWGGPLTKAGNLASRLDTWLLGRHAYEFDAATGLAHDPEGLLSTLPAIATTLLGVCAGAWLRREQIQHLVLAGVASLLVGGLWSFAFPLNKQLWTSSYVLWTGGWATLALALLHIAIDRHGWPAIGRRFGVNAIAAYAGAWAMTCLLEGMHWMAPVYEYGFAWLTPSFGPYFASLAFAVAFVAFWWLVMWQFDRRRIYLTI